MTTDLRDKTVEDLEKLMASWMDADLQPPDVMADPFDIFDEMERRLSEAQQQIAEKDAALAECTLILSDLVDVSKIACRFDLVGMPSEANGALPEAIKFLNSLHASAKHDAQIIKAAEEQEHKHILRHKAWLQSDDKTFEDAREDFMLACLRTVEAVRAKKGEKG